MKRILLLLAFLCLNQPAFAQEFDIHPNGLVYSDTTIRQLRHIVDSLHLRYRVCDPNPQYRARWQCTGQFIDADTLAEQAAAALRSGMPLDEFARAFPYATISPLNLAVALFDRDENRYVSVLFPDEDEVWFDSLSYRFEQIKPGYRSIRIANYHDAQHLRAFVFHSGWESKPIPQRWAKMIQYGECMIDTATTTYLSEKDIRDSAEELTPAYTALLRLLVYPGKPVYQKDDPDQFWEKLNIWKAARKVYIADTVSKRPDFYPKLNAAIEESTRMHLPGDDIEGLCWPFLTPDQRLLMLRLRRQWGSCSHDDSPRRHAQSIAVLAAETGTWEVFLRSHLDILNDQFPRMTDGSYAWGRRGTYIKELEALDLDIHQLMMGVVFRIDGVGQHHYYGRTGRVGRALLECKEKEDIANSLKAAIIDPELDQFNRLICYYTLRNMIHYKYDDDLSQAEKDSIKAEEQSILQLLPEYLREKE